MPQAPVDQVVPGVPVVPVDPVDRVIRVAPGDMNRVVATADTGRADMTRAAPVVQVGRAAMTRVGLADLASPGDTIPVDPATLGGTIPGGPEVTTRVDLGDMTRERLGVPSRALLASPGDTIPVGRALLGPMPVRRDRMPVRRPPTAEPPLRARALLHPTLAERRTPADLRWDHQTQVEVATRREARTRAAAPRPVDRTLRLEAIRPVGATPRRE